MSSGPNQNPNRRPRSFRDYDSDFPPLPANSGRLPSLVSLPSLRNLDLGGRSFRWVPPGERRERYRTHMIDRVTSHGNEPDELSHSLAEAGTNISALLELGSDSHSHGHGHSHGHDHDHRMETQPPPPHRPQDHADDGRRKRRKIDPDRQMSSMKNASYGRYGQVEPGALTMEIVSCDGGMFLNDTVYAAENILKNDGTVYCTKGTRCNIVLRHQGSTVFNLTELVIKAPGANYSSPVRQGMVFVSMNEDELLNRTAEYQIQYAPRTRRRRSDSPEDETRDADYWRRRSTRWRRFSQVPNRGEALLDITAMDDDDDTLEPQEAQMPQEFTSSLPPFRVTTECSEDEVDYRMNSSVPPMRIGSLPFERDAFDSDSSEGGYRVREDDPWELELLTRREGNGERSRTRESSASDSESASQGAGLGPNRSEGRLMVPHAKFHIEKGTRCTIRFDPPVSGRFILLKMWSSKPDPSSNIDIQAVMAKGFAGPRYFPAISLM